MTDKPELIYVGDPMCSWCWGVAPTIEYLAKRNDIRFRLVVGGLRVGDRVKPLDDDLRRAMTESWTRIEAKTGQPFDTSFLQRGTWVFNTELPAIAVTTMRELDPSQTLPFFDHLQQSFYRDGVDITDRRAYPELVRPFPVAESLFLTGIDSAAGRKRARDDFAERRELGVDVLPTVLLEVEGKLQKLGSGYLDRDHFDNQLTYWVEGRQPLSASVGVCSIDDSMC
jgi:putative protein-disulfide isomerase